MLETGFYLGMPNQSMPTVRIYYTKYPDARESILDGPYVEQPLSVVVRPDHPLLHTASPDIEDLAQLEWVAPRALTPARLVFSDAIFEHNDLDTQTRIVECSSLIRLLETWNHNNQQARQ